MASNITVVTACTGFRDTIRNDQVKGDAQFLAYVDKPHISRTWEQRAACNLFSSSRRNSRIHKLLIHQYVTTEYSLWMDANISLLVPPEQLISDWLANHDVAMFKHRRRTCLYEEAKLCASLKLDDPQVIEAQIARYRSEGFLPNAGLAEACVILRRHTNAVENFNNKWWSEYCRHSVRDQIGVMVSGKHAGVEINLIEPGKFENPFFDATHRQPGAEPWGEGKSDDSESEKTALLAAC